MSRRFDEDPEVIDDRLLEALAALGTGGRDPRRRAAGRAAVILAAARARNERADGRLTRWRRRAVGAALGFAGANLVLGGLVALAAGASPTSPLYGIKRAAEAAALTLTLDPQEHAKLQLQIAERRAGEAAEMVREGHPDLALDAARDATELVRAASAALADNPSVENEQAILHASDEALARLQQVFAALENGSDPGAAEAARTLDSNWRHGLAGDQSDTTPGTHDADAAGGSAPGSPGAQPGASGDHPGAPGGTPTAAPSGDHSQAGAHGTGGHPGHH